MDLLPGKVLPKGKRQGYAETAAPVQLGSLGALIRSFFAFLGLLGRIYVFFVNFERCFSIFVRLLVDFGWILGRFGVDFSYYRQNNDWVKRMVLLLESDDFQGSSFDS